MFFFMKFISNAIADITTLRARSIIYSKMRNRNKIYILYRSEIISSKATNKFSFNPIAFDGG